MFLIFDTETTGKPDNYHAPISDSANWPRMVQISWQLHDALGKLIEVKNYIVKPEGYEIPYATVKIHGITTERAQQQGVDLTFVLNEFNLALQQATYVVGHNVEFDLNIAGAEFYRKSIDTPLLEIKSIDTMLLSTDYCALPGGRGGGFKWPRLEQLHEKLFGVQFDMAHNSAADVEATARAFFELLRLEIIIAQDIDFSFEQLKAFQAANPNPVEAIGLNTQPYDPNDIESEEKDDEHIERIIPSEEDSSEPRLADEPLDKLPQQEDTPRQEEAEQPTSMPEQASLEDSSLQTSSSEDIPEQQKVDVATEEAVAPAEEEGEKKAKEPKAPPEPFVHLHLHTHYSILDGALQINKNVMKELSERGVWAMAITDHGSMFGVKEFYNLAKDSGIKPIIGCEVYVARRGMATKESKIDGGGWHLVLLAKNKIGYQNLTKLVSEAWLEGMYYKPRIDHELLSQYSEGIIALSACLGGEVNQKLINVGREAAVEAALWYKNLFGKDFYLELQRHKSGNAQMDAKVYQDQVYVNGELIKIAKEHNIPLVATNDVHFYKQEDAVAHDHLICLNTNKYYTDQDRMRYTGQEWLKTGQEMVDVFSDIPEAIDNTIKIANEVEEYDLNSKPIMPRFEIPEPFEDDNAYLRHLVYEGAHKRWGENLSEEVVERLDFELSTIKFMGYSSYFLIVWDFIEAARAMDVAVGPGRGSAAGSAVAYTLKITDIDPFQYSLLFERFLNPDRISLPDIDIDFEDEGRGKVLEWVVNKYGAKRVAHIITFGSMAAKSAIRDVGRVQQYPLKDTMLLQKMVPSKPGTTLLKAYAQVPELQTIRSDEQSEAGRVLKLAESLEGTLRNTGIHACGIIIGRDDLENYVPISTAKNSELTYVTQYDGGHVEDIGLLKMDFLGLKTLGIIKQALRNIKQSKGVEVDFDAVGLEDEKTYQLFANGHTSGIFQFESEGMKKGLIDLKPTVIGDLIAMTALYRPGPMEYIPSYVKRKHGLEKVEYDLPMMKAILEDTYGITVYQEQIMLLSRLLAGFTRGQSDALRKAMGKKKKALMEQLRIEFVKGCQQNPKFVEECKQVKKTTKEMVAIIWDKWKTFAEYAFNKSHAAAYTFLSYRTAYLKAHYPAEFMASVLSNNMGAIEDVSFFLDDCRKMGIKVLGPDVNESHSEFSVNSAGQIRFGLNAIKGVGSAAAADLIAEREANGAYKNTFDFLQRINLRSINKKSIESMVYAGAFDSLGDVPRHTFFYRKQANESTFIEKLIQYGHKFQAEQNSAQMSLFGDLGAVSLPNPEVPEVPAWSGLERLMNEKEVVGFYLSGHPLDDYSLEIERLSNIDIKNIQEHKDEYKNRTLTFIGMVDQPIVPNLIDKNGNPYSRFTVEDLSGKIELFISGENYDRYRHLVSEKNRIVRIKVNMKTYSRQKDAKVYIDLVSIEYVATLLDRKAKRIDVELLLKDIAPDMIKNLKAVAEENTGNTPLTLSVLDTDTEEVLYLVPKALSVSAKAFVKALDRIPQVKYDLKLAN